MSGLTEYRVLLRGLQDQSDEGRRQFLARFGEAYKMSPEQAAQWLRTRKGVVYTVKTPEAAEKAKRYIESLGGVASVEKSGETEPADPAPAASSEPAPFPEGARPDDEPPYQPGAPTPSSDLPPEVPADDAFVPVPEVPASAPAPVTPSDSGAPLRACPHCTFPYRSDQPICPACRRPPVYAQAGTGAPGSPGPAGAAQGYDLSSIINVTIELYKNNFVTLFLLNLLPALVSLGLVVAVGAGGAAAALLGKEGVFLFVALIAVFAFLFLPLAVYVSSYFWSAQIMAIDSGMRGQRPDLVGILKAVPPMLPLKLMANSLLSGLAMLVVMTPFIGLAAFAAYQKLAPLAVLAALPVFPVMVVVGVLLMFIMPVTVLEGPWAVAAMQRSAELGRGYYLRNFGVMFVIVMIVAIVLAIVSMPINMIPILGSLLAPLVQAAAGPLTIIPLVLLYYDMRLKKG